MYDKSFLNYEGHYTQVFSQIIRLDRQSMFVSDEFRNNAKDTGVDLQFSAIEALNAIEQRGIYHHILRRIFSIVKEEQTGLDDKHLLCFIIKSINDTIGPNGFLQSLFVFRGLPSFPTPNSHQLNQTERFNALKQQKQKWKQLLTKTNPEST